MDLLYDGKFFKTLVYKTIAFKQFFGSLVVKTLLADFSLKSITCTHIIYEKNARTYCNNTYEIQETL